MSRCRIMAISLPHGMMYEKCTASMEMALDVFSPTITTSRKGVRGTTWFNSLSKGSSASYLWSSV